MKAGISDVAKLAGVSIATVSRVINGNYPIKNETREAVLKAIEALRYTPNRAAVSLSGGPSKVIGFVCPKMQNITNMHIAAGIEQVLSAGGYGLFIASSENSLDRELQALRFFKERAVDAMIVSTCMSNASFFHKLQDGGTPVILVDRYIKNSGLSHVKQDSFKASYNITRHLIDMGHRNIAVVVGPLFVQVAIDRRDGFLSALKDAGISPREEYILYGEYNTQVTAAAVQKMLDTFPKDRLPTAIFAGSEAMTVGVVQALAQNKFAIPKDISVVSYGPVTTYGVFGPVVTGVHHMYEQLGEQAALLAIKKLNRLKNDKTLNPADDCECIELPAEIIYGNSVKDLRE